MITAQVICELIDAGLSGDALKAACRRIDAQLPKPVDEAMERRRAYDRERKRNKAEIPRNSTPENAPEDSANSTGNPPDSTGNPQMRDIDNNTSLSVLNNKTIPQRHVYPPEFENLWELFPRKVGKDEALRSWKRIRGRVDLETLKTAVSKHAALCAGKEKQFIPHPATWLNDGRWQDEDLQPPKPVEVNWPQVYVQYGTDAGDAWERYYRTVLKKTPPRTPKGGWYFPSEYPEPERKTA